MEYIKIHTNLKNDTSNFIEDHNTEYIGQSNDELLQFAPPEHQFITPYVKFSRLESKLKPRKMSSIKSLIQPKLKIGKPNDRYEKEADIIAEKVVQKLEKPSSSITVKRRLGNRQKFKDVERDKEEMKIMKKPILHNENNSLILPKSFESQLNASKGKGNSLTRDVKSNMESTFGTNFSRVKIHTDSEAIQMNEELGAKAFTHVSNIYFNKGEYAPESTKGRKLLAHELTHVIQQDKKNSKLLNQSFSGKENIIQRTPTSVAIEPLISYRFADWEVTPADESTVIRHLRADPDVSSTITDLNSSGMLDELIERVDETSHRRSLIQILGNRLNSSARTLVEPLIQGIGREWEMQYYLAKLRVLSAAPAFSRASYAHLIGGAGTDPFSGVGATGVNPKTLGISYIDQFNLWRRDQATVPEYSNPISGSLPAYLDTLSPSDRTQQAKLLLNQPISSVMESSYAGEMPSRAQVMRAAAIAHNLQPQIVAAFILAEQRDQSRNEDAKDYIGATTGGRDLSIGLGQVVISTARRNDLFSNLLSSSTRSRLSHDDIALLLASDEFNILATAKYIRKVANDGSGLSITALPNTQKRFPGVNLAAYSGHSSGWPDDNIRVLAMYYTSRAWTDDLRSAAWGYFVFKAYQDVIASRVF